MSGRATIRDVARAAQVSTATVSRFLNGSGYVNEATSARIREAIALTGYTPSLMARSLKTRRSGMLLLIVPDISNPFYAKMARELQRLAQESGYATLLWDSGGEPERELEALEMAVQMSVEGVLFATIDDNAAAYRMIEKAAFRTIGLNAFSENAPFDVVAVDGRGGTDQAVMYLAGLGHRRIAFAGGRPGSFIGESRRQGFLRGMEQSGLAVGADDVMERGFAQADGYAVGAVFARRLDLPTAVCCANDLVALGVISALNDAGLRVPDDVSVTGMDDIDYAALSSPPLTTVTNDAVLFAHRAFEMLLERIGGDRTPPHRVEIPNALVVRRSAAAPRI